MRFVYLGPPDEPNVSGTRHAMTGEWVKGEARDIGDAAAIAWLRRHPHWQAVDAEAVPAPQPRPRGRPRKVA